MGWDEKRDGEGSVRNTACFYCVLVQALGNGSVAGT